jgi:alcohol dehydrogenase (NADP+)
VVWTNSDFSPYRDNLTPQYYKPYSMSHVWGLGLDYLDLYLIHWPYAFQRGDNPFPRNEDQTMQ